MTVKIGYITRWRQAIFFTMILDIIIFGLGTSILRMALGTGIQSNMASVFLLILCVILLLLVIADKWSWFDGEGTGNIQDGNFTYKTKKKSFSVKLTDIKKVDMEKIVIGETTSSKVIAYKMLIKTNKKKYYIESDRAYGREYNEVDLHKLYIYLQENLNKQ